LRLYNTATGRKGNTLKFGCGRVVLLFSAENLQYKLTGNLKLGKIGPRLSYSAGLCIFMSGIFSVPLSRSKVVSQDFPQPENFTKNPVFLRTFQEAWESVYKS